MENKNTDVKELLKSNLEKTKLDKFYIIFDTKTGKIVKKGGTEKICNHLGIKRDALRIYTAGQKSMYKKRYKVVEIPIGFDYDKVDYNFLTGLTKGPKEFNTVLVYEVVDTKPVKEKVIFKGTSKDINDVFGIGTRRVNIYAKNGTLFADRYKLRIVGTKKYNTVLESYDVKTLHELQVVVKPQVEQYTRQHITLHDGQVAYLGNRIEQLASMYYKAAKTLPLDDLLNLGDRMDQPIRDTLKMIKKELDKHER
jgi:hypothetical protein